MANDLRQILAKNAPPPARSCRENTRTFGVFVVVAVWAGRPFFADPVFAPPVFENDRHVFLLKDGIREALPWRIEILVNPIPRRFLLTPPPHPTPIYSDASGPCHVGAAVFFDSSPRFAQTHLPGWRTAVANIYEFELAGAIFGLTIASFCSPGRPFLICIDNSSASCGLVRGNCDSRRGRFVASVFWVSRGAMFIPRVDRAGQVKTQRWRFPTRVRECIPDKPTLR